MKKIDIDNMVGKYCLDQAPIEIFYYNPKTSDYKKLQEDAEYIRDKGFTVLVSDTPGKMIGLTASHPLKEYLR